MKDSEIKQSVRQCLQGNTDAFGPVVRRYRQSIHSLCRHYLGTPQDAEDAAADVFIKAYRRLAAYDPGYAFSTWLYRIAVNHCIALLRRRKLETAHLAGEAEKPGAGMDYRAPEAMFFEDVTQELYRQALAKLPDHYRTALLLKYQQDLSYKEISGIMEVPVNTVGSLILRGKTILKETLLETLKKNELNEPFETKRNQREALT